MLCATKTTGAKSLLLKEICVGQLVILVMKFINRIYKMYTIKVKIIVLASGIINVQLKRMSKPLLQVPMTIYHSSISNNNATHQQTDRNANGLKRHQQILTMVVMQTDIPIFMHLTGWTGSNFINTTSPKE